MSETLSADEAAQERADVMAVARAVLALHQAGPALCRLGMPADFLLARGLASNLAELIENNGVPADVSDAIETLGDVSAAFVIAAEVWTADGQQEGTP